MTEYAAPEEAPSNGARLVRRAFALTGWTQRRGQFRGLLLIAVTALVFWILFRKIDVGNVFHTLQQLPPGSLLLAFLLTLSFSMLSALRWQITLHAIGHHVAFGRCLKILLGISPISAISPSKAGDFLKAASFRGDIGILEVTGTVLAERIIDVLVLSLLSLVGGLLTGQALLTRVAAVLSAAGFIGVFLLPVLASAIPKVRLREKAQRVLTVYRGLRRTPRGAALVVALTILNWVASIVQTAILLHAVGSDTPLWVTTAVLPMAIFVGLLPITLGGMGTRDAAFVALLAPTASATQALTVGLLYSFFGYWLPAILGLPFLKSALFPPRKDSSVIASEKTTVYHPYRG